MKLPPLTLAEDDPGDPFGESEDFLEYCRRMDEALAALSDEEYVECFGHARGE